jgi:tetratricopeptide (TPR) repeat protein
VFGLGAILCAILTGQPPYVGQDAESTRQLAAFGKLEGAHARLTACGADPELVALCKRCLSPDPIDRPPNAGEVAKAVAGLRAAAEERARRAELDRVRADGDRAKAQAEAREQRKRRKVQLALAAAVGVLLAGGGAFAWHLDRQSGQRRAQLSRNADALAALVDQCEEALQDNDADRAAAAIVQIDQRLTDGGGEAVSDRVERCRADLAMLQELDRIDAFRWTPAENKLPDNSAVADRWQKAFGNFGIIPGSTRTAEAARRVADSRIRNRLLEALDLWLVFAPSQPLADLLREADADEYRDAVRTAVAGRDEQPVRDLVGQLAALEQPSRFAVALGSVGFVPAEGRRPVLEKAAVRRPSDLTVLMGLGYTYPINQPEGATQRTRWFQAAVAASPRNIAAHNSLGIALKAQGDLAGAVAAYREAIRLDPKLATAHYNLGIALAAQRDLPGAVAEFKDSIRLDPTNAPAHNNLAHVLRDLKDPAGAVAACKEAIRLDPTNARTHNILGHALWDLKDPTGAAAAFREAVRLDPKFTQARSNLGTALLDQGDLPGAVAVFKEATRVDPSYAPAHSNLGAALVHLKDLPGAVAAFKEAIRIDPKLATAHNNLARLLAAGPDRLRADKAAVEHATRACELFNWKHPIPLNTLAAAYAAAGDFDKAVEYQQKALSFPALAKDKDARERLELYRQKKPYYDPAFFPREPGPAPRVVKD